MPPLHRRARLRPFRDFGRSLELVRDHYGVLLAAGVLAFLISSLVPFNLLLGPCSVGMALLFLRKERGEAPQVQTLFDGFDDFGQRIVGSLLWVGGVFVAAIPIYFVFAAVAIVPLIAMGERNETPDPLFFVGLFGGYGAVFLVVAFTSAALSFAFPLMAERRMEAWPAFLAGLAAVRDHLGGVLALGLLHALLLGAGMLLCCVGVLFVMPFYYASIWHAYRTLFPPAPASDREPPPSTAGALADEW